MRCKKTNTSNRSLAVTFTILLVCLLIVTGSTFSLFTSESKVNIAVTAGNVDLQAIVGEIQLYSMDDYMDTATVDKDGKFENGGTLGLNVESDGTDLIKVTYITPGDKFVVPVALTNESNIDIMYRVRMVVEDELAKALTASVDGVELNKDGESAWAEWVIPADDAAKTKNISITVEFPLDLDKTVAGFDYSDYEGKKCNISLYVDAVQGNAPLVDTWDGTADTTWFTSNPDATEYALNSAEAVVGLSELIDDGKTMEGKTIKLAGNVDLYKEDANGEPISFDPIGSYRFDQIFKGVFDGQGYTISGLNQNTWALNNGYYYNDCGLGLFGAVENATIKNLVIDGASISGESALCGIVAAVAGDGCTFENITIKNAKCADYQYYAGGIVGWASGKQTYNNCNVDESVIIAAQWGDFDNSVGGLIGGIGGFSEILFKNCIVACRIDAYNDVTSTYRWYAYRRAGMLVGNSGKTLTTDGRTVAIAPQITCENVTVIYGDWANYTYCEFAGTSWPYVRVQAGVSNSAYSNPRYGHPTDANGNAVVDDNHVHNDGEDHHILCVFDQLYGGGQGVYGNPEHDGVKVIYNNK